MTRYFRILKAVAFVTFKEWAAYRSHLVVSLFVGPVYFGVQYFIWRAVFESRDTIQGLSFEQMLAYYGIVTLMNFLIMDFADWNLQMLIRTGKFLTFMLRPLPHWFFAFSQKVGHRILGVSLEFVPVYIIFFFVFRIKLLPAYPIWCLISLMLSFMMMFFINYTVGIIGFWIVRTQGVRRMFLILRDIFAGVFIPLSFFPEVFQKILFFLPFQFITYVPVRVFIGTYELAGISLSIPQIVFIQAIEVFAMWLILLMAWNLGIKKFSGVGA